MYIGNKQILVLSRENWSVGSFLRGDPPGSRAKFVAVTGSFSMKEFLSYRCIQIECILLS